MQSCYALQLLHNNLLPPGRGDLAQGHARRCIAAPLTASPSLQPVHLYVSRTQGVISQLPAYARAGTLCTRCGSGGKCGRQHAAVKPPVSSQLALQHLILLRLSHAPAANVLAHEMHRLGSCVLQFDASDFLLAPYGSPDAASLSDSPLPPSKFDQVQSEATQGRTKFAALRVRLPCGSPSSPASHENGLSPASTASVSETTRSPARRAAGAGAGASRPDSEGSEACSSSDSEADRDAGSVLGASAPEPEHGGRGGSRAGTPSPALAAGASPEGPPQQACTTPPAFQLACSGADPWISSGTGSSSRALTPAGLSPAQQLEVLAARLEAEADARRAAQRQLAAQRAEAEQQRQALAQQYEARLVALRQELQQAAEEGAGAALRRSILVGGGCWAGWARRERGCSNTQCLQCAAACDSTSGEDLEAQPPALAFVLPTPLRPQARNS